MIAQVPAYKRMVALAGLALFACAAAQAEPAAIQALIDQDNNQQALAASNEYLSSNADDADARFLRGIALARLGKTDAAVEVFGKLARENPQTPEYANNLAVLYAQKGDYEKARRWLEAAMSTHPAYATAHRNLGDVYTALAAQAYSKALDQQGDSADLGVQLEFVTKLYDTAEGATVVAQTKPANAPVANQPEPAPVQPEPAPESEPEQPPRIVKAPKPKPEPARPPQPSEPEPEPTAPSAPVVPEPAAPAEPQVAAQPAPQTTPEPAPQPSAPAPTVAGQTQTPPASGEAGAAEQAEPAPQPSAPAPKVAEQTQTSPAAATSAPASGEAGAAKQAVRQWAQAWANQDVQAYLDSYADNFYPGDNVNLAQWRQTRKERVAAPDQITVALVNLKVRIGQDGRARATFQQNYSADNYSDKVTKTLILQRKDNTWRIVRETSAPL